MRIASYYLSGREGSPEVGNLLQPSKELFYAIASRLKRKFFQVTGLWYFNNQNLMFPAHCRLTVKRGLQVVS